MLQTQTLSHDGDAQVAAAPGPYLILALECARPLAGSERLSLVGVDEVQIGRGRVRGHQRRQDGDRCVLRVDVPDARMSTEQCRMRRDEATPGGSWMLEDDGSKNGTAVNVDKVERARIDDGDLVEAAKTMLV